MHRLDSDLFIADAAGERIGVDGEPDRGLDVDAAAGPAGVSRLSGLTTSSTHQLFGTGMRRLLG